MVAVAESFGVAVVTFVSGKTTENKRVNSQIEETRLQLAAAINPSLRKKAIHYVQISLGAHESKMIEAKKTDRFGYSYKMDIKFQPDNDSEKQGIHHKHLIKYHY